MRRIILAEGFPGGCLSRSWVAGALLLRHPASYQLGCRSRSTLGRSSNFQLLDNVFCCLISIKLISAAEKATVERRKAMASLCILWLCSVTCANLLSTLINESCCSDFSNERVSKRCLYSFSMRAVRVCSSKSCWFVRATRVSIVLRRDHISAQDCRSCSL